ncbi:MAG: cyclic nucleotide-binding domain-containing protein [Rhodospirillaceae bacterium]|nr:cyclic nucleotide-binding domain-containing protein [Rhodospirillaceae bacterium]MBL6941921.1 cyclic nucleotide-binding domain-containing protein [Rhodospirillales bacterium]
MSDRVLERKVFQAGDKIFKEGEDGNLAFVLQSGEVEIVKNAGEEHELVLATVGQGGIIGEMALLDNSNRMATARASQGGAAIVISRQMFEAKMKKADPFLRGLLNILADHVRRMSKAKAESIKPAAPAEGDG